MKAARRHLLNLLGVMLVLAMCGVVALLLQRSRERSLDDLRRDTRYLTSALALSTGGVIRSIDQALLGGRDGLALLQSKADRPGGATVGNQLLRSSVAHTGLPVALTVLDAQGRPAFSTDDQALVGPAMQRDYFKAHLAHDAGLFIGALMAPVDGKASIVFSRRIDTADGGFGGIILAQVPVQVFEALFHRLEVGAGGSLILADDSGILLARRPAAPGFVGKKVLRDEGALGELRSGRNAGVRINHAPVDGVQRMLGFERVGATRLVVGVGHSLDERLAGWRREALVYGTVILLFGMLTLLMLFRATRHASESAGRAAELERSEERVRSLLAHAPDAFIGMDHRGLITDWNAQAEQMFGWRRDEVVGRVLAEVIIPPRLREDHNAGLRAFVRTGAGPVVGNRLEVMALHRDGHEIPVELSVGSRREDDVFMASAFLHDISERKEVEARMIAGERRLRTIADNLPVLISYVDKDERLQFCNDTFRAWMGIDPAEAVGRHLAEVLGPALYEDSRERLHRALAGERVGFEVLSQGVDVNRHLQTVYIPDVQADGTVAGIYTLSTDVTALKIIEHELTQLAHVDELTGLPNRRQFEAALQAALSRSKRNERPIALMLLDVDRFKEINDTHGHAAGDSVLREVANRIRNCTRVTDTVARLAGDEFVVILEGLRANDEAAYVARKIVESLRCPFDVDHRSVAFTASIGVALVNGNDDSPADVMSRADAALYQAKRAGRDGFVVSA